MLQHNDFFSRMFLTVHTLVFLESILGGNIWKKAKPFVVSIKKNGTTDFEGTVTLLRLWCFIIWWVALGIINSWQQIDFSFFRSYGKMLKNFYGWLQNIKPVYWLQKCATEHQEIVFMLRAHFAYALTTFYSECVLNEKCTLYRTAQCVDVLSIWRVLFA